MMCIFIYVLFIYVKIHTWKKNNNTSRTPCLPSIRNRGEKAWITLYICIYIYIYSVFIYIILYLLFYIILYWFYHWLLFLIIDFKYLMSESSWKFGSIGATGWLICVCVFLPSRFLDRVQKMLGEKYLHFLFGQARKARFWGSETTSFIGQLHLLHIHRAVGDSWENHGIRSESMWCSLGSMDVSSTCHPHTHTTSTIRIDTACNIRASTSRPSPSTSTSRTSNSVLYTVHKQTLLLNRREKHLYLIDKYWM